MNIYLKHTLLSVLSIVTVCVAWATNWFVSLFTYNDKWPTWTKLWSTPDNPPSGDRKWKRENIFPDTKIGRWRSRTGWLNRNPANGFAYYVAGFKPSSCEILVESGDKRTGDKRGVAGYYSQKVMREGEVVAFQYYLIAHITKQKCFMLRWGWKMNDWPSPKDNLPRFEIVHRITPYKSFNNNG
jgi:hypothetical protein